MQIISWISANWSILLNAVMALFTGVIALALIIPGEQPEKFLQGIVDFLSKLSAKPKE